MFLKMSCILLKIGDVLVSILWEQVISCNKILKNTISNKVLKLRKKKKLVGGGGRLVEEEAKTELK